MKIFVFIVGLLLSSLSWLSAQVSVEIQMDAEQFLKDESLPLKIRIVNMSGQALGLGQAPDWLTFHVERSDGSTVRETGRVPVQEEYTLENAQAAVRHVDIMPYYNLSFPGQYWVSAKIRIKGWNEQFTTKRKMFEIISGLKVWEQEFGVPGTGTPPEVRKYMLQQANGLKRLMLYLRITDARDSHVFRVMPIGPLVSFSRPEAQVDKDSNLHVLSQTGGWSFAYYVVDPDGKVLVKQRYDYDQTRPALAVNEGKVKVAGGSRHNGADDIPHFTEESQTNEVKTPQP